MLRPEWSMDAVGARAAGADAAAGGHTEDAASQAAPVELALAAPLGGRIGAGIAGAIMVGGGGALFLAEAPWRPAGLVTIRTVMAGPLLLLMVWFGLMLVGLALTRPGRVRIDADRITIIHPSLLTRPLVLPRAMIRAVTVDVVADREPRLATGWSDGSGPRSQVALQRLAAEEEDNPAKAPWWPADLERYLPLLAAGVAGAQRGADVAVLLSGPLRIPARASTWLVARTLAGVMQRPLRPGRSAHGVLLRLAQPPAGLRALRGWLELRPLTTAEVAAIAPRRAGLRPQAMAWTAIGAILLGTMVGHGYWSAVGEARIADQGCRALDELAAGLPRQTPVDAGAPHDLPSALPATGFPALGVDGAAEREAPLRIDRAAALQPDAATAHAALERHGFVRGYGRQWQRADGAQIQALVYEFSGPQGAAGFDAEAARLTCAYADDAFVVAGVDGAVGLRVRTHIGVRDQASFLRGPRRYEVRIDQPLAEDGLRSIAVLAEAAARAAR